MVGGNTDLGEAVTYFTCEELPCYADMLGVNIELCDSVNYDVLLYVSIAAGFGPYQVEIDSSMDMVPDITIDNYYSGSSINVGSFNLDSVTFQLTKVIDLSNGNEVCNLGSSRSLVVNPTPELQPLGVVNNICPSSTVDLSSLTLIDNNPLTVGYPSVIRYYQGLSGWSI